ncbi:MAG: universal stress protein [Bacteroidales bacterium]|nr:universal stress protein [Bacteroidales bacterium]
MDILVAIDFSEITEKILEKTKEFVHGTETKVCLIHVVQPEPDFIGYDVGPQTERDFIAKKFQEKHKSLQEKAKELEKEGLNVTPLLLQGPTVETILAEAEKLKVGMIMAGSHGHGKVYNLFVGSISKGLLNYSTIPLLIIPAKE